MFHVKHFWERNGLIKGFVLGKNAKIHEKISGKPPTKLAFESGIYDKGVDSGDVPKLSPNELSKNKGTSPLLSSQSSAQVDRTAVSF